MGKVFAQPSAPAAPAAFDLFAVTVGSSTGSDQPRDAHPEEIRRYLLWQAERLGVLCHDRMSFRADGIYCPELKAIVVPMPGYGQSPHVVCELLDDAGAVIKVMPLPVDRRGKLPMNAAQVQEWTGLEKVRKARKPKAVKHVAVAPVAAQEAVSAPAAPEVTGEVSGRLAALEAAVTRLAAVVAGTRRNRTDAERRAIARAWRMRGEARVRADLDRRALLASREQYDKLATELEQARVAIGAQSEGLANLRDKRSRTAGRLARTRRERFDIACALIDAQDELARLRPLGAAILAFSQAAPAPSSSTRRRPHLAAVA